MGDLQNLAHLSLNNNLFSGALPASLMLKIDVLQKKAKHKGGDDLVPTSLKYVNMVNNPGLPEQPDTTSELFHILI
jgi:hypothetical protein